MKGRRREFEIFSLSFLDVISCGFGAVVLLVLVSNFQHTPEPVDTSAAENLLSQVLAAESRIEQLEADVEEAEQVVDQKDRAIAVAQGRKQRVEEGLGDAAEEMARLEKSAEGLALVEESLKRAAIKPKTTQKRDDEVGGIPVDSDYVVFVVDTSGSMKNIWNRVTSEIDKVLSIHPRVKGFQILNDNGRPMISGYAGRFIPDTPSRRASVLRHFRKWSSGSNSSPVEGIEAALGSYAKPGRKLSIYTFGDDYTGGTYDPVVSRIKVLNTNRATGKRLAKIHAVGFLSGNTTDRYSVLMREVTRRNGGTFIALPR